MRVQLTDRFCASAKSPGGPQTDYFDGGRERTGGCELRLGAPVNLVSALRQPKT